MELLVLIHRTIWLETRLKGSLLSYTRNVPDKYSISEKNNSV